MVDRVQGSSRGSGLPDAPYLGELRSVPPSPARC